MNYTKNKRKGTLKRIWNFFEGIITILIVVVCLIIITQRLSGNEKSFLGYRLFKIETGSMIPKYNVNDVILVTEIDPNELKVGDDLVYVGDRGEYTGVVITHQLVKIEKNGTELEFYTKGLANNEVDPVVHKNQIIGVVRDKSEILTFIINMLLNPYTLYFLVVLPVTLTIFFREVHSKDVKERYVQRQIEREKSSKSVKEVPTKAKKDTKTSIQKNTKSRKNTKT